MPRRLTAALGSLLFLVVAPGTVAGFVPWWISCWEMKPPLLGFYPFRGLGAVLIALGLPILLDSFKRFALQGLGTPAPLYPTRRLVVTGFYRYVRNPMYVALVSLIIGQGLLLGDRAVLVYGAVVWVCCHLFVVFYEEPTLARSFGQDYDAFRANVRRWLPRLRPWRD